jgi:hypothetical protein
MGGGPVTRGSLLAGAVDLHVHPSPSPYPRRVDPIGAARAAAEAGMRAIVLKSHHSDTAPLVDVLRDHGLADTGVEVYGGVVLNTQVGGLNPHAVSVSLAMGGRVVWMPTISSPAHIASTGHFPTATVELLEEVPVDIWSGGDLVPELATILRLIADADAVLASGHLPPRSIMACFEAAREAGVRRLLINHPNFIVDLDGEDARRLVELGSYVEHEVSMYDPESRFHAFEISTLVEWMELAGPERTILASDLGQAGNPLPPESLARIGARLIDAGIDSDRVHDLLATNPARLLGLDGAGDP